MVAIIALIFGTNAMWLKKRRVELNLSQDELAKRIQIAGYDIGSSTVSHWENGRYKMPLNEPDAREAIAVALELSVPDMLLMAGYEIATNFDESAQRAASIVQNLPPDAQRAAVDQLRVLERLFAKSGS